MAINLKKLTDVALLKSRWQIQMKRYTFILREKASLMKSLGIPQYFAENHSTRRLIQ